MASADDGRAIEVIEAALTAGFQLLDVLRVQQEVWGDLLPGGQDVCQGRETIQILRKLLAYCEQSLVWVKAEAEAGGVPRIPVSETVYEAAQQLRAVLDVTGHKELGRG